MNLKVSDTKREDGFTLIELLVVVIIIGILAAIAIPVFLNQRESAWQGSVESDVRNAAIQVETDATRNRGGEYDATLDAADVETSADVSLYYRQTSLTQFELCGEHSRVDGHVIYNSGTGGLGEWQDVVGRCTDAAPGAAWDATAANTTGPIN